MESSSLAEPFAAAMGRLHHASARQHFLDLPLANAYTHTVSSTHPHSVSERSLPSVTPLYLTSQEESTRVQLQKQRLREQHHAIVVSQRIPGLKTSAGECAQEYIQFSCHGATAEI